MARRNVIAMVSGCSNVAFANPDFCISQSGDERIAAGIDADRLENRP
jgi:hypothetical protein